MLNKREIIAYTKRLDKIANEVQGNWKSYGMTRKAAYDFCLHVDTLSDRLEGLVGLNRKAKSLDTQPDEPYMQWFDTHGVVEEGDADEEYMGHFRKDPNGQFQEETLEGEPQDELTGKNASANWYRWAEDAEDDDIKEEEGKKASFDYWNDSRFASKGGGTDYWNDSRTAGSDYWE